MQPISSHKLPLNCLAIHPTFRCFHRCAYCSIRQEYFARVTKVVSYLPVTLAFRVIGEAIDLGATMFQLSGGDPLLYPDLIELIRYIKTFSQKIVYMNSVGSGLTHSHAEKIIDAGLDGWNFSIDSLSANIHDYLRGKKNALDNTLLAMSRLRSLRDNKSNKLLRISMLTVITRINFRELPELINFAINEGLDSVYIMNIYGDWNHKFILTSAEILEFKYKIIPTAFETLERHKLAPVINNHIQQCLSSLYSEKHNSLDNYARGQYWLSRKLVDNICDAPNNGLIVEANGDVLPCCAGEISGNMLLGNLLDRSLSSIWQGVEMSIFRRLRSDYCLSCPSKQNKIIWLREDMINGKENVQREGGC